MQIMQKKQKKQNLNDILDIEEPQTTRGTRFKSQPNNSSPSSFQSWMEEGQLGSWLLGEV